MCSVPTSAYARRTNTGWEEPLFGFVHAPRYIGVALALFAFVALASSPASLTTIHRGDREQLPATHTAVTPSCWLHSKYAMEHGRFVCCRKATRERDGWRSKRSQLRSCPTQELNNCVLLEHFRTRQQTAVDLSVP